MIYFVLLCAGKGTRMNINSPKQYLKVNGEYLFMYSVHAFKKLKNKKHLIIAAEPKYFDLFKENLDPLKIPYTLVKGGKSRQESVLNSLESISEIKDDDKILIHDSARMFINLNTIKLILNELKEGKNSAIPYKNSNDALFDEDNNRYIKSRKIKVIETPQGFNLKMLKDAYLDVKGNMSSYRDDGSIFLNKYNELNFVLNPDYNLKITSLEDLAEIERYIR